jgi:acyl carrier protein
MTADGVLDLMVGRMREVLALDWDEAPGGDWRAVRFDEDLHADSLDLVEMIEGVERALAGMGHRVSIPDAELIALRSVGEAVDRILTQLGPVEPASAAR